MSARDRKKREKERHRHAILQAAEAIFAREGYHGATIQEIAENAEFSVGYLYRLFENKKDLYVRLLEMRAERFLGELRERLAAAEDVVDKVRVSVEARFEFFRRDEQFFRIFTHLMPGGRARGPVFIPERCRRMYRQYLDDMAELFAQGTREGVFVDEEPMTMALCLEGMTRAALAYKIFRPDGETPDVSPAELERIFLTGVLAEGAER